MRQQADHKQGPPPPKVPEGWKAVWNDQYHEWFFVNIYTKQSTWEKPTGPVYPPGEAPHGVPPAYGGAASSGAVGGHPTGTSFNSNNPYGSQQPDISEDEKLARKLQEEEQARAGRLSGDANRGASNNYYGQPQQGGYGGASYGLPQQGGYPQQQYQAPSTPYQDSSSGQSKSKGLLGKLLGKSSHGSSSHHAPQSYGQTAYAGGGGYYGGQQMYQQQHGYAMPPGRRPGGGGMGMGGMAMGAGAGLLGGAMLGSALGDAGDGGDYGGDGGDYGGDGGDFGGDGGGDFGGDGGGDFGGGD